MTIASDKTGASVKKAVDWRVALRQKTAKTARWLHIYLSMVSFAIVLFFSVTGITLNHPTWFADSVKTRQSEGTVDRALLPAAGAASGEQSTSGLVQWLRGKEHLHGAVDEVRVDDASIGFSYRAPGYSADVTVDRKKGTYAVTEVRNGFVAVMNDLHKGRDSGKGWGWLIDVSGVLLVMVSFTGLVILWFVYKRRTSGLMIAVVGGGLSWLIYKAFVP